MKKGHFLAAVAGMLMVCGCGEKKETKSVQPVKVRVEQVRMTDVNGEQGYSGTVEEVSGAVVQWQRHHQAHQETETGLRASPRPDGRRQPETCYQHEQMLGQR